MLINKVPDTHEKLQILSQDSQYDLACACATNKDEHRKRSKDDKWIYPVSLPQGGKTYLFKTLLSNECTNNCKYCPLRVSQDPKRCQLTPQELAKTFMQYWRSRRVSGLFLSSGVIKTPDETMSRINSVARILRQSSFRGYLHLKIIPGASKEAIREAVSLASAVSINIETAGEKNFKELSTTKDYQADIIGPLKFISELTSKESRYSRVKQTTQFVVGAANETDQEIVKYSWNLYQKLNLNRVYFSAYQRGVGDLSLPGESSGRSNSDMLMREHRLYQVDWLIRKYGFCASEIIYDKEGNLSLDLDPKEIWARNHREFFPLNVNRASKPELLRIPGLGEVMANRILAFQKYRKKIRTIEDLGKPGKLLLKAKSYITF